jgi:hypothetical protein
MTHNSFVWQYLRSPVVYFAVLHVALANSVEIKPLTNLLVYLGLGCAGIDYGQALHQVR